MSRITIVEPAGATGEAKTLLDAVQAQLGVTPKFIRVLANAPAAVSGAISTAEFDAAHSDLSEEEVVEGTAHVALNVFTNLLGKSTQVTIDFPEVTLLDVA